MPNYIVVKNCVFGVISNIGVGYQAKSRRKKCILEVISNMDKDFQVKS